MYGNKYIFVAINYVSKWVDTIDVPNIESKSLTFFLKKNILTKFESPREIISDGGSYIFNRVVGELFEKFGVKHKVVMSYHPKRSGQLDVSNPENKYNIRENHKYWSCKLGKIT